MAKLIALEFLLSNFPIVLFGYEQSNSILIEPSWGTKGNVLELDSK